ncbi:hypothetical protein BLNAU_8326 [Blattamonas nauphoetae]|uniref:Uncharacterized protein n=1 Tax=Blattamonas nauphoetae TaxID=2049346 RepID=A0ABQ9XYW5_9EUKA|nr:hypothetical protein BLNAU_8326 [Blattamonas nauphoetae]
MLSTRLMLRMNCSPFCFVIALLYIECLRTDCGVRFTSHNAHTLFLTATVVSTKYLDDQFFFNKHYAHLGGIAPTIFNDMERTLLSLLVYSLPFDVCHFEQLAAFCQNGVIRLVDRHETTFQSGNLHSVFFHIDAVFADRALQSVYSSQSASQRRPRTPQTRSAAGKLLDGPGRLQCHPADAPSHHRRTKSLDVAHYFYPLPQTLSYSLFRYRSYGSVQQTLSWGNNGSPPPASSPNDPEGLTGSFFFTDKQSSLPPVTHPTTTSFAFPLAHLLQMKGIQPSSYLFPTLPPSLAVTPPVGTSVSPVFFSPTQPAPSPATLANPTAPRTPTQLILPCGAGEDTGPACSAHLGTAAIEPQQPRAAPPLSPEEHRRLDRTDAADVLRSSSAAPPPTHCTDGASSQPAEQKLPTTITVLGTQPASKPRFTVAWTDTALPNITPHPPALHKTRCRSQSISGLAARAGSTTLGGPPAGRAHPTHKADHSQFTEAPDVLKAPPLLTTPSPTPFTPLAPRPVLHPSRPSIAHQTRVRMLSLPRQSTPHSCAPPLKSAIDLVGTKWGGKK